jgi:multiple antibiotic resistance protein
MTFISAVVILLAVLGPTGNVPFFLSLLKDLPPARQRVIILRELVIALVLLLIFMVLGKYILGLFQLTGYSLSVAGGIVLFLISLKLIFSTPDQIFSYDRSAEPFIVPLAVPSVAGPSAIITVMLMASREPHDLFKWVAALVTAWAVLTVILLFSGKIGNLLGEKGLNPLQRLMGMLLSAISVQMLLSGLAEFISTLK